MKRLLLTFTPDNRFFFGDSHGYDDTYIISSKKIPPLSTILGTIRKSLLVQNKILSVYLDSSGNWVEGVDSGKDKDIKTCIGDFDYNVKPSGGLGQIESISPVFIKRKSDGKLFYPLPCNWQVENKLVERRELLWKENEFNNFNGTTSKRFVLLEGYNPKLQPMTVWVEMGKWQQIVSGEKTQYPLGTDILTDNDFFEVHKHPGIRRSFTEADGRRTFTHKVSDQGFFQKEDFSFKSENFCFAVLVEVQDNTCIEDTGVLMGGDKSIFFMKSTEFSEKNLSAFWESLISPKQVLESDTIYAVLSETNISSLAVPDIYCVNKGRLEKQRRLVLGRNADYDSKLPYRLRMKGGVIRTAPIGSLIITTSEVEITSTSGVNPIVGFDRLIEIGRFHV